MQNAPKTFATMAMIAALAACSSQGDQQHNADNAIEVNSSVVEVNTLPADESSATSSEDLAAGATEPVANETSNGY